MHLIAFAGGSDFHWTSRHARRIISGTNCSRRTYLGDILGRVPARTAGLYCVPTWVPIISGIHIMPSYVMLYSLRRLPPTLRRRARDAVYPIKGILPRNICKSEYVSSFPSSHRFCSSAPVFSIFVISAVRPYSSLLVSPLFHVSCHVRLVHTPFLLPLFWFLFHSFHSPSWFLFHSSILVLIFILFFNSHSDCFYLFNSDYSFYLFNSFI